MEISYIPLNAFYYALAFGGLKFLAGKSWGSFFESFFSL